MNGTNAVHRMSCDPPPPPTTGQSRTTKHRPKAPPPRRPVHPVAKEKQPHLNNNGQTQPPTTETKSRRVTSKPPSGPRRDNNKPTDVKRHDNIPRSKPVVTSPRVVPPSNHGNRHVPSPTRTPSPGSRPPSRLSDDSPHLSTLRLRKGSLDDDVLSRGKPLVQYVQVIAKDAAHLRPPTPLGDRGQSKSVDELDRYNIFLDLNDISGDYFCNNNFRSSFLEEVTLKRQTIGFHSDVQTLLKHSKNPSTEHIYSLPQPQSYSDNTLKAVRLITDKYDTLQRRRLHAASFREGDLAKLRGTLTLHRELSRQPSITTPPPPPPPLPESPILQQLVLDKQTEDVVCPVTGLGKRDVTRLEALYRGLESEVFVCNCMAEIYLGSVGGGAPEWLLFHSGVPVWVLNSGRGVRTRELHVYLADRVTGLPVWSDKVNYLTNLEICDDPRILTMRLSGSLSKMVRFSIVCADAAESFVDKYLELTVDPNDVLWCVSSEKQHQQQRKKRRKGKRRPLRTQDVSQPCNFQHYVSVLPEYVEGFQTVQQKLQLASATPGRQRTVLSANHGTVDEYDDS